MRMTDDDMKAMIRELEGFVFTAARDWQRSLKIRREERDYLVAALRAQLARHAKAESNGEGTQQRALWCDACIEKFW
jgi:hypothetical protein